MCKTTRSLWSPSLLLVPGRTRCDSLGSSSMPLQTFQTINVSIPNPTATKTTVSIIVPSLARPVLFFPGGMPKHESGR